MTRVLFVCMGNICRSPIAEGLARSYIINSELRDFVEVDSAGTHHYQVGRPPDSRARWAAAQRGVDISARRARQIELADFQRFDLILAMDRQNLAFLHDICPEHHRCKLGLFLRYAGGTAQEEVPDPYDGSTEDFENVTALIERAARGLLTALRGR